MKKLKVNAAEFENLLYPAMAISVTENAEDMRTTIKILDKLEKKGELQPRDKTGVMADPTKAMCILNGGAIGANFSFEDAEAKYLVDRLVDHMKKIQAWQGRDIIPMIDQLEKDIKEK